VVVGVIGARALEDLQVDLLAYFGLDRDRVLLGGSGAHPDLLPGIIA
jgi:hypothetical protein